MYVDIAERLKPQYIATLSTMNTMMEVLLLIENIDERPRDYSASAVIELIQCLELFFHQINKGSREFRAGLKVIHHPNVEADLTAWFESADDRRKELTVLLNSLNDQREAEFPRKHTQETFFRKYRDKQGYTPVKEASTLIEMEMPKLVSKMVNVMASREREIRPITVERKRPTVSKAIQTEKKKVVTNPFDDDFDITKYELEEMIDNLLKKACKPSNSIIQKTESNLNSSLYEQQATTGPVKRTCGDEGNSSISQSSSTMMESNLTLDSSGISLPPTGTSSVAQSHLLTSQIDVKSMQFDKKHSQSMIQGVHGTEPSTKPTTTQEKKAAEIFKQPSPIQIGPVKPPAPVAEAPKPAPPKQATMPEKRVPEAPKPAPPKQATMPEKQVPETPVPANKPVSNQPKAAVITPKEKEQSPIQKDIKKPDETSQNAKAEIGAVKLIPKLPAVVELKGKETLEMEGHISGAFLDDSDSSDVRSINSMHTQLDENSEGEAYDDDEDDAISAANLRPPKKNKEEDKKTTTKPSEPQQTAKPKPQLVMEEKKPIPQFQEDYPIRTENLSMAKTIPKAEVKMPIVNDKPAPNSFQKQANPVLAKVEEVKPVSNPPKQPKENMSQASEKLSQSDTGSKQPHFKKISSKASEIDCVAPKEKEIAKPKEKEIAKSEEKKVLAKGNEESSNQMKKLDISKPLLDIGTQKEMQLEFVTKYEEVLTLPQDSNRYRVTSFKQVIGPQGQEFCICNIEELMLRKKVESDNGSMSKESTDYNPPNLKTIIFTVDNKDGKIENQKHADLGIFSLSQINCGLKGPIR